MEKQNKFRILMYKKNNKISIFILRIYVWILHTMFGLWNLKKLNKFLNSY